jgi:ankyrin repeat protein
MSLLPPPQHDDPIITQFKPVQGQWELTEDNIKRIDPQTGETILHNYCQYINTTPLALYQYLIETHGCDINAQDHRNSTPLHRASGCFNQNDGDNITVLMYLLNQKGVNVNIKNSYGETFLHLACEKINKLPLEIFKSLIDMLGGDVNVQDHERYTPIHRALDRFDPNDGGDVTVLTYLINQKNVDVNIKDRNGDSLLHYACKKVQNLPIDVFKVLIEAHGCDINAMDSGDNTPLHYVFRRFDPNNDDNITVLAYLINQKNFNVNIKGRNGRTFLHLACTWDILDLDDVTDTEDEFMDSNVPEAKFEIVLSQIVEIIAERCVMDF